MRDEDNTLNTKWQKRLNTARRLVVKVGTSTVMGAQGEFSTERLAPIAHSLARLMAAGKQIVLVSSGAVGLGRAWLGLHRSRLNDLVTKQACAAVGQSLLMNAYRDLFSPLDVKIAQVLLTEDDFSNWRRYSNIRHTMERLVGFGVLPIVNENDTVSTAEIESISTANRPAAFSDNDRLAALVMSGLEADALVLLTNVDGFFRSKPGAPAGNRSTGGAEIIPLVDEITAELRGLAAGPSPAGRGGMFTKLEAAEIAMNCGGIAVIANGQQKNILDRIFAGERLGTGFLPSKRIRGKRRWIAYAAEVKGRVVVDAGARRAIAQGKSSLLASGVVRIEHHFAPMDVVSIVDRDGSEFARGIANCASHEAENMQPRANCHSAKEESAAHTRILIRRDNIVLLQQS